MFRFFVGLFICLAAISALFGSGDDDDPDAVVATPSQASTPSPSETKPVRSRDCIKVSLAMARSLAVFGAEDGFKNKVSGPGWAVRSDDFKKVFFIAVPVRTDGVESTPVFASTYLDLGQGGGLIWAVNSMADTITAWPLGEDTDANITMYDHGADEVENCLL